MNLLARIPSVWLITLGVALYTILTAARRKRWRDASTMGYLLLAGILCVVYLCVAGNVLG